MKVAVATIGPIDRRCADARQPYARNSRYSPIGRMAMMKIDHALFHVSSEKGGGPTCRSVGARGAQTGQPRAS